MAMTERIAARIAARKQEKTKPVALVAAVIVTVRYPVRVDEYSVD